MRWFAILLAILLGGCRMGAPGTGGIQPYRAFAWTAPERPLSHVVGLVRFQATSNVADVAAALGQHGPGERFLLRWESNDQHFWGNPADLLRDPVGAATQRAKRYQGPWVEHGAAAERAFEGRFARAMKDTKAAPDFLVLDTEFGISSLSVSEAQLRAITADGRWPEVARQFRISDSDGILGTINTHRAQDFNLAMQVVTGADLRLAYFEPWHAMFPGMHCSDFGDGVLDLEQAAQAVDDGGCIQPMGRPMHGDMQSPYCYAWVHGLAKSAAGEGADFGRPMTVVCWLTSMVRAYARSPAPIIPWVAGKSWTDGHVPIVNSPYQDELLWQVCLSAGCTDVLFFNPDSPAADDVAMERDLAELERQTGGSATLVPLTTVGVPFGSEVLVSGARCTDGRRIYRVTASQSSVRQVVQVVLPPDKRATSVTLEAGQTGTWVRR